MTTRIPSPPTTPRPGPPAPASPRRPLASAPPTARPAVPEAASRGRRPAILPDRDPRRGPPDSGTPAGNGRRANSVGASHRVQLRRPPAAAERPPSGPAARGDGPGGHYTAGASVE